MPTTLSLYNMVLLLDLPLMYTIILTVFVYYLKFFFFFLVNCSYQLRGPMIQNLSSHQLYIVLQSLYKEELRLRKNIDNIFNYTAFLTLDRQRTGNVQL